MFQKCENNSILVKNTLIDTELSLCFLYGVTVYVKFYCFPVLPLPTQVPESILFLILFLIQEYLTCVPVTIIVVQEVLKHLRVH